MKNILERLKQLKLGKFKRINIVMMIAIIGMVCIVTGSSFALFSDTFSDTKTQIIQAGKVKLELIEPVAGINLGQLTPQNDINGLAQNTYYDFTIKNIGSTVTQYKVYLLDDEEAISTYEGDLLSAEYIKIGLEVNGKETGPMNLGEVERIINERFIEVDETVEYSLRIWLNETIDIEEESGKKAFFKIKVVAEQCFGECENKDSGEIDFVYKGNYEKFVVPKTGYYEIELWGAEGSGVGGLGGYTKGTIYLTEGEMLYVYVGQEGNKGTIGDTTYGKGGAATFNGGGNGGNAATSNASYPFSAYAGGASGGGATDIRYFATPPTTNELNWNNTTGLRARIMVAGGGGGTNSSNVDYDNIKSHGGGLEADRGGISSSLIGTYDGDMPTRGSGGTQTTGGKAGTIVYSTAINTATAGSFGTGGTGGDAGLSTSCHGMSGGGGGYYGGGGGQGTWNRCHKIGGGGGSSYISGYAGVNSVTSITSSTAANKTKHYSSKYFINTEMKSGVNSGNGKAKITYIGTPLPAKNNTKLNNVGYIKSCINGNSVNIGDHWVEIQAIKDGENIAKGKPLIYTVVQNTSQPYANIVDGNIDPAGYGGPSAYGLQCVTINLGATYDLDEVGLWLYWADGRKYYDNTLSVGSTSVGGTTSLSTVLHSFPGTTGYVETSQGRRYTAWD